MKIIIGAMEEELSTFVKDINAKPVNDSIINEYYSEELDTIVAWVGIGISNASTGLSYLLAKYNNTNNIEFVINAGTACGVNAKLKQNDFVIVDSAYYSTADATAIGYKYGQVPQMPISYQADVEIEANLAKAIQEDKQKHVVVGSTATSDVFFSNQEQVDVYINRLNEPILIAEMECAAFFQTAYIFNQKIGALKIVSDVLATEEENGDQFDAFLPKAAKELSEVLQKLVR
ncbi:5'-methylthioadenosine/S-adenosylhomocysteine nucleosidase [Mesoplasma lactucae]|uniref:adenosylhomocysteine nucleosidase n=1 Tax=Mesoplasma lactucae ATCC 49193 TaxID=81460 RepID=A0A291IRN5_9MOLU|nr:5'-methylthioadenosine/S-adenosylhomocysteine nucleosidase [Mesoplasma lactucae]ATG97443.1 5'-methylthioadenosine/S-adenosylhomocysteine nucleosidase [Mesoplasma lactucae ATCC 49193]ATZ20102.1 5'-methylthioadenosine/S-adenosylhomocysteine nucleosidase [Mesoplasma lactucae ATCC 49193]MCL8216850.1 5'-methylthioadenosine/S-adenosylhomocysteine nucleosidase [Mesoplasma lactucae ATCC 49193]